MTVDNCIRYAKELLHFDARMFIIKIGEISNKHNRGEKLTEKEKFIIGMRYSEFLAEGNSDEEYYEASIKRDACLKYLGLDFIWVYEQCKVLCNLY